MPQKIDALANASKPFDSLFDEVYQKATAFDSVFDSTASALAEQDAPFSERAFIWAFPKVVSAANAAGIGAGLLDPLENALERGMPESSTYRSQARQVGRQLLAGAMDIPSAAVGLIDLSAAAPRSLVSSVLGTENQGTLRQSLAEFGLDFGEAQKILEENRAVSSQVAQAEIRKAFEEDGVLSGIGEYLSNPSEIMYAAARAAPSMLGIAGVARAAAGRAGATAAAEATAGGATAAEAATAASNAIQAAMPRLAALSAGLEGAQQAGSMAYELSEGGLTGSEAGLSAGSGIATTLLGRLGGALGAKMGLDDVEAMIATQGMRQAQGGGFVSAAKSAIQEGLLEEAGQSASEQVFQNLATGRPVDEGVTQAAAQGAITGMAMGGIAGFGGGRPSVSETIEAQQSAPAPAAIQLQQIAESEISDPSTVDTIAPDVSELASLVRAKLGEQVAAAPSIDQIDITPDEIDTLPTIEPGADIAPEAREILRNDILQSIEESGTARKDEVAFLLQDQAKKYEQQEVVKQEEIKQDIPAMLRAAPDQVAIAESTVKPTDIQPVTKTGEADGVFASMTSANVARDKLGLSQTHVAVQVEYMDKAGFVLRPIEDVASAPVAAPVEQAKQVESKATPSLLQPAATAAPVQAAAVAVKYEPVSNKVFTTEKSAETSIKSQKLVDVIVQPVDGGYQIVRQVEIAAPVVEETKQAPIATAQVEQLRTVTAALLQPAAVAQPVATTAPAMAEIVSVSDDGTTKMSAPVEVGAVGTVKAPDITTQATTAQTDIIANGVPDQQIKPSYAGVNAANADLTALQSAKQRIEFGDDANIVRNETGWFKGPDSNWRFEIDDKQATFAGKDTIQKITDSGSVATLDQVFSHPTLFQEYPHLRGVTVQVGEGDTTGITQDGSAIVLGADRSDKSLASSLIHEVQHAIQIHEGFSVGASNRELAAESARTGVPEALLYTKQLGEIEARDVQVRQVMSPARRAAIPPYQSQAIPESEMIVSLGVNQKPMDVATVTNAINKSLGPVASSRIQVVENAESAAQLIGDRAEKIATTEGSLEGFYDPKTGRTVLIAANIKPMHGMTADQRAAWVGWHELYHRGVGVANRQKYDSILSRASKNKYVARLATAIAQERGTGGIATEEALGELAAAVNTGNFSSLAQRYGVQFSKDAQLALKQKSGTFSKLWAEIKAFLSEFFGRTPTDEEIGLVLSKTLRDAVEKDTAQAEPQIKPSLAQQPGAAPQRAFVIADETVREKQQRIWQDDKNRWQVVQDAIKNQGGTVTEQMDVRAAMDRKAGRTGQMLEGFKREVTDLMKSAIDAQVDLDDVALYLYALHAPERNAYIATINPRFPDGGSGMTDQEAARLVRDFEADPNFANIQSIADQIKAITSGSLNMLVAGGVMPAEQAAAYRENYKNYVPLKGFEKVDEGGQQYPLSGSGFSMPAKLDRRALGRSSRAGQIIENIIVDRERALDNVEKANVGRYLLNLIASNPDDNLWTIDRPPKSPSLTTKDGKQIVDWRQEQYDKEREIRLLLDGETVRIQLKDPLLLRAYNNLGAKEFGTFLNASSQVNSILRQFWTQKNPAFILINPIRDVQAGAINLIGEGGVKLATQAAKSYAGAMRAMYQFAANGKADSDWNAWVTEYRSSGGSISFPFIGSVEQKTEEISRLKDRYRSMQSIFDDLANGKPLTAAKAAAVKTFNNRLFDLIENVNTAAENALRLASYRAARELGMSKSEAASISRHVGPNFNKRGEMGPQMGALYLFANSNIQGSAQMLHTIMKSPHKAEVQGIIGGLAALGMIIGMMEADDDDDTIAESERQRNWIIKFGDDYRITIPKPYGWSSFVDVGRAMGRTAAGKDPMIEAMRVVSSFMGNFSPVGSPLTETDGSTSDLLASKAPGVENVLLTMTPTAFKPLVMSAVNKGSFGGPLMPDFGEGDPRPDSEKLFRGTRGTVYDSLAKWMNASTGGDEFKEGWVDVSPETLKNIVGYTTGGAGRFLTDLYGLPAAAVSETAEIDTPKKIPIVKSFVKKSDLDASINAFFRKADEAEKFFSLYRKYEKTGHREKAQEMMADSEPYVLVGSQVNAYKKALRQMRDYESEIDAHEEWTTDRKKSEREMVKNKQQQLIDDFNQKYKTAFSLI